MSKEKKTPQEILAELGIELQPGEEITEDTIAELVNGEGESEDE